MWARLTGVYACGSFREECRKAGKKVMAWTVNEPAEMIEVRLRATATRPIPPKPWLTGRLI